VSSGYRAVQWSPGKRVYDTALGALLALYLTVFLGVTALARPEITIETALIRAFGTAAFVLLHVVLAIGPLARLDRRFLPLLWNRRHLGVTMFLCALAHGSFALVQFHGQGDRNPLVSLLASDTRLDSLAQFPFQPLGALALAILFLMAATSHDFWLAQLTAPVWKALHMGVYVAYGLVVAHVLLGALQDERAPAASGLLGVGLLLVLGLHLAAARREWRLDATIRVAAADGFVDVGRVDAIAEKRAKVVALSGERVAVFRYDGKISALSNVCQHQNGPLGEGKIVDGCVTCPWHGYQYRPADGASPAPFSEKVPTFRVRIVEGRVLVDPRPLPPGTAVTPATFDPATPSRDDREAFFVGYLPFPEPLKAFLKLRVGALAAALTLVGAVLGAVQRPLGWGSFDYGVESRIEGLLQLEPIPALWRVEESSGETLATGEAAGPIEVVPLVGLGKHGAAPEILALAGREVKATGSWIRRGPERLFEIARAEALATSRAASKLGSAGPRELARLRGEVVDLKCYLGVMKPGEMKSHKACAIRCLSGGTPAGLAVRADDGRIAVFWLVAPDGGGLGPALLDVVAEPVEVEGEVARLGSRALLVTDRARIRRLATPPS